MPTMLAHRKVPQYDFTPFSPSPLSPCSANIHARHGPVYMPSEPAKPQHPPRPIFSQRTIKKAPVAKQDELKEKRRDMFLKKVREGREDKRFESRGEDIMRLDFVQRRKQWEAEKARSAPLLPEDSVEEEMADEMPVSSAMQISTQEPAPEEEADEVALRENEELDALLSLLPADETTVSLEHHGNQGTGNAEQHDEQMSEHFGSDDDDDYDALFIDYMHEAPGNPQYRQPLALDVAADEMDTS